jgi:predicted RNase H-like nuclease (RuvC/YqgF family)
LVVSAINKAAILRKQISTHRDKPDDPVLNSKLKEINGYQKAIMKMKYPKVHHNPKIQEMQDESEIILAEISKLEDERSTLKKQNLNRKKAYKEVMTNNQDQYARLDTLKESLREEKEGVSNCS